MQRHNLFMFLNNRSIHDILLNMCSKKLDPHSKSGQTRQRILDAAITRYAMDGLEAPLRAIAADAHVTAGLILHYFGSQQGLRTACDELVSTVTAANKLSLLDPATGISAATKQAQSAKLHAPMIGYVLRLLQEGGPERAHMVDRLADDAETYLEQGERLGTIRPSRDPKARARVLSVLALGCLLIEMPGKHDHIDLSELSEWIEGYVERVLPPFLEILTSGVLIDAGYADSLRRLFEFPRKGADPM